MPRSDYLFTSESVSEGHPDKVCDRISDAVVDAFLAADPVHARVACETLATTGTVVVAGEVRGPGDLMDPERLPEKIEALVRNAVRDIGYEQPGFDWRDLSVTVKLHAQSGDIAQGVDASGNRAEGAGDQGIMFGYACSETGSLMPAPLHYAHRILKSLAEARHNGAAHDLGPDSKSQVTLAYENGRPVRATSVVVSTQHDEALDQDAVREIVRPHVVDVLPDGWMCPDDRFYVNPTGKFVTGGPDGDCGLTGRKIIVDTYGGAAPHGGGAFSGKDPSKVDRSAAYACRYLAKNVVAAGLADSCTIQVAYAIGVADPLSLYVDLAGTGEVDERRLEEVLRQIMDLTPRGIRNHLGLDRPIYETHGGLWSLWTRGGGRRRVFLGEDRSCRRTEERLLLTGGQTWGRRRGRRLSPRRQFLVDTLLPELRVVIGKDGKPDLESGERLWLEIGFGGGEHLAWQAERHPEVTLIGAEVWLNGVAGLLDLVERHGLANVRIFDADVRVLLEALPPACLERIFVLFPDPWPKARHRKRRFINQASVARICDLLVDGGELRLATDIEDYALDMEQALEGRQDLQWSPHRPSDWPPTRYEAKARAAGRELAFLTGVRRHRAITAPGSL